RNCGACAQCFQASRRKRQRGKSARCAFNETESQQFASNRLPGFAFQIAANAVRGQLIVTSLPDRFRVRAAENIDNVIQSKSESAFRVDAMYAGEKFLRRNCAIERLARREAIIAPFT